MLRALRIETTYTSQLATNNLQRPDSRLECQNARHGPPLRSADDVVGARISRSRNRMTLLVLLGSFGLLLTLVGLPA